VLFNIIKQIRHEREGDGTDYQPQETNQNDKYLKSDLVQCE